MNEASMTLHEVENTSRITLLDSPVAATPLRRRHLGMAGSFVLLVVVPIALTAWYLFAVAVDQFSSTVGFSVRKEEVTSPIEIIGGIADFASSGSSDTDILYEFISSQELVARLETSLGLSRIYSLPENDPVFAYRSDGTIEDLRDYWQRMVRVTYDSSTELIEVQALAFTPKDARLIAQSIFEESARLVDDLSAIAQQDTITFAKNELDRAVGRLKAAREAMTRFRSRTQIVDPSADLQGQMGLLSTLEQQLAEALINADLLRESTVQSDPRITQANRRIAVIQARIADERQNLGHGNADGEDYATLLAEFERLSVDREFAEQAYTASLATYDQALAEARRKSRYLAAYIRPTLAEASEYPRRPVILSMVAVLLLSIWTVSTLVYYSIRDRR